MNGEKEDFYILLWSSEDIKIHGEDLDLMIQRETPSVEICITDFEELRNMKLKNLKRLLKKNSVLIICSSEKVENMHSWKLGFIMGQLYVYSEKDKERIIGFVKGDEASLEELRDLLSLCESESEIKEEITNLIEDMVPNYGEHYHGAKRAAKGVT